ncbi:MAG: PEP/pyruvate-binding domain-containing protein [Pseudomonadota bacterium]
MESDFHVFHELMSCKIREILLVASPYDAFIMEEDGNLATRIIDEYQGLNLSHPPRLQRVSSAAEALAILAGKKFDLVITMPHISDMDVWTLGREIKKNHPKLPVVLLAHALRSVMVNPEQLCSESIDHFYIWQSDPSLLLAIVKNVEDHLNVAKDTEQARVRVLLLVEDSPHYLSYMLPLIYSEVVKQTQAVLTDSLNYEHRLLKMRARPKILAVRNYEEACRFFERYRDFVFGVIADGRFPVDGRHDDRAGLTLLGRIRGELPDLPLLLMSAQSDNRDGALAIPAVFLDKNSPTLSGEIHDFFLHSLGFGDFVFRLPDGTVTGWAGNLHTFEEKISTIPEESLLYHASRNHFSNWIMARAEVELASRLQKMRIADFSSAGEMRKHLVDSIHQLRKRRQQGIIAQFSASDFDPGIMDFVKIGKGSLGGKARGLAFMANQLAQAEQDGALSDCRINLPQTLVIASDGYDSFLVENRLSEGREDETDGAIAERFFRAEMPVWLLEQLKAYLARMNCPLSVRSSSLLEDAQYAPYAGLYSTYMLANNHPDFNVRLQQFLAAIKLVYASTSFAGPRAFSRRTGSRQSGQDKMAVIVQQLIGGTSGDYFYPAISGVAQSRNYYPVAPMLPEEGVAHIALGFGKTVVEGEKSLRFSPRYPKVLPQFSTVDDILTNAQRFFYALKMDDYPLEISYATTSNLVRREVSEAAGEFPVQFLSSSYNEEEHRIRDGSNDGAIIPTFAQILKYNLFPLPGTVGAVLDIGCKGMGCPVEVEFAVDLKQEDPAAGDFYFLQMRPMAAGHAEQELSISQDEEARAVCSSGQALGHGIFTDMADIVYVDPATFDPARTREMAREINRINGLLQDDGRSYLLVGPGRWGSADRWLGIPVQWEDISGVGAIIELRNGQIKVDPSQGSHFFHNITSMGIPYITVTEGGDRMDWQWLGKQKVLNKSFFLRHVRCKKPFFLKLNGRESRCVVLSDG